MNDRLDTGRPPGFLLGCLGLSLAWLAASSLIILGGIVIRDRWHLWGVAVYAGVLLFGLMWVVGRQFRETE